MDDEKVAAIEVLDYKAGVFGRGIEIIVTYTDNNQTIFISNDSEKSISKDKVFIKSQIDIIRRNSVYPCFEVKCSSKEHCIELYFESIFPVSNYSDGKVDADRHSNDSIPYIYVQNGTVAKKCYVKIDGIEYKVKKSDDIFLKKNDFYSSYYTEKFNLGIITSKPNMYSLERVVANCLEYKDKEKKILKVIKNEINHEKQIKVIYEGFKDASYILNFHETPDKYILNKYKLILDDREIVCLDFDGKISFDKKSKKMYSICELVHFKLNEVQVVYDILFKYEIYKKELKINKQKVYLRISIEQMDEDIYDKRSLIIDMYYEYDVVNHNISMYEILEVVLKKG